MCPEACDAGRRRGERQGGQGRQAGVLMLVMLTSGFRRAEHGNVGAPTLVVRPLGPSSSFYRVWVTFYIIILGVPAKRSLASWLVFSRCLL